MRRLILGTAGHIDHGKTTLVHALTGVDTDRLPEEKRRGITIDLGFACLPVSADLELAIVDVPGHEAFVRNMLAGATGIDLVMLVIAADEGVMPQTREHLAIVELLGITRGVVALTRMDAADAAWAELVRDEVRELLAGSGLARAAVVPVSGRTGMGLDELRSALAAAAADVPERAAEDLFRMPIDRIFTVRGTGTVVTGTVWSGSLRHDATVRIEPAGAVARVRMLQRHGSQTAEVRAGERAAVALAGFDRHALRRGDVILTGDAWRPASMLTVTVTVIPDATAPLRPRQRVRLHLGTAEVLGRVALPGGEIAPGRAGLAQLRLEAPVVARAGDRFVLRSYSPVHTIAGGTVLEPDAPKRKRFVQEAARALQVLGSRQPADALGALIELAGPAGVSRTDLPVLLGLPPDDTDRAVLAHGAAVPVGDRLVAAAHTDAAGAAIVDALRQFHGEQPLEEGSDRETLRRRCGLSPALLDAGLRRLMADGTVVARAGELALAGHAPGPRPQQRPVLDELARLFHAAGLEAPDVAELPAELGTGDELLPLLRYMERRQVLVRLSPSRWADAAATAAAAAALRAQLPTGQELPIADLKTVLGVSRKHLIPLLEYFDRIGVCVRRGEARIITPESQAEAPSSPQRPGAGMAKS